MGLFCLKVKNTIWYNIVMIEAVVNKYDLNSISEKKQNLEYWLLQSGEERVSAVDYLRKQVYGDSVRLQRVVKVIQRS